MALAKDLGVSIPEKRVDQRRPVSTVPKYLERNTRIGLDLLGNEYGSGVHNRLHVPEQGKR